MKNDGVAQSDSNFDQYGRCIPSSLTPPVHKESRRYFTITQPQVDYHEIYHRLNKVFNFSAQLSVSDFEARAEAILSQLRNDECNQNITSGVAVPFILPQANYVDIGEAFQSTYLDGVKQAFQQMYPTHSFDNFCKDSLQGKFSTTKGSRQNTLIQAMQKGVVVGYYFPCLLEYSVPAAIERIAALPEYCILAGGFDTSSAFIGSPSLLLREDGYPPLLWASGFSSDNANEGYHFEAYGYDLTFNRRMHLGQVAEYWASGLVVLG